MNRLAMTGAVLCLTATGSPAFAQDEAARKAAAEVAARVPFEQATKGAPYSADSVIEGSQTLADGNRINRKSTGRVYRDSEGRTRREEDRLDGSAAISIVDPVAGFSYSLDTKNKIAWRTATGASDMIRGKLEAAQLDRQRAEEKMQAEEKIRTAGEDARAKATPLEQEKVRAVAAAGAGGSGGGAVMIRSRGVASAPTTPLEHKTLEGVAVEGRKSTIVIPAGQIGNEQPLTIVSEEWRSPELNVLVMTRHADPRMGESTYRLQNIIRAEPDRSLFMVPPDYTVKDTGIKRMLEASRK
jgi:hypothetical protein